MTGTDLVRRAEDGNVASSLAAMRTHARSFTWAAVFLPAARREDVATVYAFCRYVDDLADESRDEAAARRALEHVAETLRAPRRGDRTIVDAYQEVVARRRIPEDAAIHLIDGVLSDFGKVRFQDDRELLRYCYRVAGTVGLMMAAVLGVDDERAYPHAIDLGIGMQLTNICRDVKEDGERGRCYIPQSRLDDYGVTQGAVIAGDADRRAVGRVVYDLMQLADRYYESADDGMRFIPFRSRVAIVIASRVYRSIGRKLARWNYDPFAGRAVVSWVGKLYWVLRAIVASFGRKIRGTSYYLPHKRWLHRRLGGLPCANVDDSGPSDEDAASERAGTLANHAHA